MDLRPIHLQDSASSSSASAAQIDNTNLATSQTPESRAIRSSARVKAAKQKQQSTPKNKNSEPTHSELATASSPPETLSTRPVRTSPTKATRSREATLGKGKAKETAPETARTTKRQRRQSTSTSAPLVINEPVRDIKGKKRAAPELDDDNAPGPSNKRSRSIYALRSTTTSARSADMPRKPRASASKSKGSTKAKMAASGSSKITSEDIEMLDAEYSRHEESDAEVEEKDPMEGVEEPPDTADVDKALPEGGPMDDDDEDDDDDDGNRDNPSGDTDGPSSSDNPPVPGGMDEATALAIFGDYRQFGSYMMSLSTRLKTMLTNIKSTADPTTRLLTLQELSELLSISTEDTLAGSFQVEQFVRELVKILGGRGDDEEDDDRGGDGGADQDEDAALAAALAMSGGNAYQGDDNLEAQVLACRCLANLMEALPGVAHTVVYHGAIPVLCSKLIEISYIDLAEQTLSTMEKISEEFPSAIVREGGLAALLNYLDFFSIAVQRTALQAAANCCRNVSTEHFSMIRGVWPIIRNCLSYSDQRLVEFACLCVIRVIDSYHRSSVDNLEALVDADLIRAVNQLLLPAGASPLIPATYTLLLRALATSARASPKITIALLEADIVDTLYQILTGVLPSAAEDHLDQGGTVDGQGLGGGLADMTVMENLAHRPKDQVEEALSLVSELLPPLPKDGVFDHKTYTEKALAKLVKARAKAERAAARLSARSQNQSVATEAEPATNTPPVEREGSPAPATTDTPPQEAEETTEPATAPDVAPALDRTELLRSKSSVVGRFMQLLVPILVDVYAASVNTSVRIKTLTGLLKAVSFLDGDGVRRVLAFVPIASFASSILSSKDHPSLVIGVLQLVDLLLGKASTVYKPTFRREGVFHEVETLAERTLTTAKPKEKDSADSPEDTPPAPVPPLPGLKKLSSLSLDPEDAVTLRARVVQFKYLADKDTSDEDAAFANLSRLVERISSAEASEKECEEALWEIATLFASPHTSISSFELLKSGIVDGLLQFATDEGRIIPIQRRKELLYDAFAGRRVRDLVPSQTPLSTLVKKLQESLTKMESFDVITVSQNSDDSKRSSPSLLARQLRLRLIADVDSDIPRNLHNIVVSIHAIATFQALHDYLRPRVSGLLGGSSRLSNMFAALAASGFMGSSRSQPDEGASRSEKPATVDPTPEEASSSSDPSIQRRRSSRLSAKRTDSDKSDTSAGSSTDNGAEPTSASPAPPVVEPSPSEPVLPPNPPDLAASDTVVDSDLHGDFSDDDDEIDAEVFNDEVDPDTSISEKTITVSVAEDGEHIEAQTPEGTRVATPNAARDTPSAAPKASASTRTSYAAALKTKPTDWHLEFSMDDHILPLDLTIYGAIHQHEMRKKTGARPLNMIWSDVYTIKFKKVNGPIPSSEQRELESPTKTRSPSPTLSSLAEDAPPAKILRLLRLLFQLNTLEAERVAMPVEKRNLPETAFVNNKLTAKLTRQLEEPMIVASSCLPDWALDLPQHFPFLFPFATRYNFLQSTSFGYARLILKWQSQQNRGQDNSRRDDSIGFLGRLQRQKVRISRKHILESAVKVFELYGSSSSVLEVEYFEEVGTGLGPTLEFYSLVSKEFARKDLKLWRDSDASGSGVYVDHPNGLYPAPLNPQGTPSDAEQKRIHVFKVIGQFVAKAMLDSRIIDLAFNKVFLKLVLGEEVPLTIASLKLVDVGLAKSLDQVQKLAAASLSSDKVSQKVAQIEQGSVEDLTLDFTIPGYDIELCPGGRDKLVTSDNVSEYVAGVLDAILGKGILAQVKAFREGFSKVFPISDLRAFSTDELVMLFGNADEDWSLETLSEAIKADHGFNVESKAIRDLIDVMTDYDPATRRAFLQFITGSPKLPIGGFRGLNPPLTVVRKPHEPPLSADDYLPSVMTCVNYLKLPEYSSKSMMKDKLQVAMQEGVGSFHLS